MAITSTLNSSRRFALVVSVLGALVAAPQAAVAEAARTYEQVADWAELPAGTKWQYMMAVDIDSKGDISVLQCTPFKALTFSTKGKFLRSWGDGELPRVHGFRIDRQDNIWITDRKLHQVLKFTPDGKLLMALGTKGLPGDNTSTTALNGPADVAFGSDGEIVRAPNLQELFNPGLKTSGNVSYPGQGTLPTTTFLRGNPDLAPEAARTLTVGAVYQPTWLPGVQGSVDYYKIKVNDAIGFFSEERIIRECFAGNAAQCAQLSVSGGTITVSRGYVNLSQQTVAGIDFELSYKTELAGGDLGLRLIANHGLKNESVTPGSPPTIALGLPSAPKWGGLFQVDWKKGPFGIFVQERYLGTARQGTDTPWVDGIDIADGKLPAQFYTNLTLNYDLGIGDGEQQLFVSVQNVFNNLIPFGAYGTSSSFASGYNAAYDSIGRYFTAGVRMKF